MNVTNANVTTGTTAIVNLRNIQAPSNQRLLVLSLPVIALITVTPLPAGNRDEPDRKIELMWDFLRDGLFAAGPQLRPVSSTLGLRRRVGAAPLLSRLPSCWLISAARAQLENEVLRFEGRRADPHPSAKSSNPNSPETRLSARSYCLRTASADLPTAAAISSQL